MPIRIQRQRKAGWKKPEGVLNVARPGRYGNPYFPGCGLGFGNIPKDGRPQPWPLITKADMVRHFKEHMRLMERDEPKRFVEYIAPLRGKDLMCWCALDQPCHADVLIEIANRPRCEEVS